MMMQMLLLRNGKGRGMARRYACWCASGSSSGSGKSRQPKKNVVERQGHLGRADVEKAMYMEDVYHILARKVVSEAKDAVWMGREEPEEEEDGDEDAVVVGSGHMVGGKKKRFMVGVCGAPGSGKSTLAKNVVRIINGIQGEKCAVMVPMDGFHYFKSELDQFEDPEAAHARRGAYWTFDGDGFVDIVRQLKDGGGDGATVYAPSFDHGMGDPSPGKISIEPHHSIVIVEGNYLMLGRSCDVFVFLCVCIYIFMYGELKS